MSQLNIEVLKLIVEKLPEDFTVEFDNGKTIYKLSDEIQVNVSGKKVIFKKY